MDGWCDVFDGLSNLKLGRYEEDFFFFFSTFANFNFVTKTNFHVSSWSDQIAFSFVMFHLLISLSHQIFFPSLFRWINTQNINTFRCRQLAISSSLNMHRLQHRSSGMTEESTKLLITVCVCVCVSAAGWSSNKEAKKKKNSWTLSACSALPFSLR